MNQVLRNSYILCALAAFGHQLAAWWREGALHHFFLRLTAYADASLTGRLVLSWAAGRDAATYSAFSRLLAAFGRWLERLGAALRESVLYRALARLCTWYLRIQQHSIVLRLLGRVSLRQWLLLAFAWYLPLEYLIRDRLQISFIAAVWEEVFLLLAVVFILWRRALGKSRALRRETTLDSWLLLFFGVGFFLMCAVAEYPRIAFAGYRIVVEYMLWYFLLLRLVEDDADLRVIWQGFLLLAAVLALHGIYQYLIGVEIPSHWVTSTESSLRTRVFSITGSPNILGALLVLLAPLAAAGVYYYQKPLQKTASFLLVGAMLLCALFTFSRGAWLGLILAVVIFSLLVDKRLLTLLASGMAAVLVAVPSITSRITYLFSEDYAVASSVAGRAMRWEGGLRLLENADSWLGFGLGRFGGAVAMTNQVWDSTTTFRYYYMDNYYLKTLVEMGYLGLGAFVLLLLALLYVGFRAVLKSGPACGRQAGTPLSRAIGNPRVLAAGIFSGLCGVLLHCYFENIFEEPYMTAYFWGLAAILVYLGFFRKKTE